MYISSVISGGGASISAIVRNLECQCCCGHHKSIVVIINPWLRNLRCLKAQIWYWHKEFNLHSSVLAV
ncbi:hypothetical protein L1987_37276 [Smallanthus sonchifolius]|uniref:Uncharacterized protein n=1 Tax=Smallanthus sonchifolius TaxID=185202 RepID=A0ACB9HH64_9ASTR|nr:hypothetical protein L1987_37276 [Smallanthus sonchifolius]